MSSDKLPRAQVKSKTPALLLWALHLLSLGMLLFGKIWRFIKRESEIIFPAIGITTTVALALLVMVGLSVRCKNTEKREAITYTQELEDAISEYFLMHNAAYPVYKCNHSYMERLSEGCVSRKNVNCTIYETDKEPYQISCYKQYCSKIEGVVVSE